MSVSDVRSPLLVLGAAAVLAGCSGLQDGQSRSARAHTEPVPATLIAREPQLGLTTHVPPALLRVCRELQARSRRQRITRPVICPPVVPTGRTSSFWSGALTGDDLRAGYSIDVMSAGLPNANGGHWVFAAGTAAALRGYVYVPAPATPAGQPRAAPTRPIRTVKLRLSGRPATVYYMPRYPAGGYYGGHVVVQWKRAGVTFQISLHGYSNLARAELMAQAIQSFPTARH